MRHARCRVCQTLHSDSSPIDLNMGPSIEAKAADNYRAIKDILCRLTKLCTKTSDGGEQQPRKHEQRLLRNLGAHKVVLELLQIPYEKVRFG